MDSLEKRVADILDKKGIKYIHESEGENQRLDFFLPDFNIFIEVKQFSTPRSSDQLASQDNVILIQGKKSIVFLENMLLNNIP